MQLLHSVGVFHFSPSIRSNFGSVGWTASVGRFGFWPYSEKGRVGQYWCIAEFPAAAKYGRPGFTRWYALSLMRGHDNMLTDLQG